jgi:hypothetical protein
MPIAEGSMKTATQVGAPERPNPSDAANTTNEAATDDLSDHPFGKSPTEAAPIGFISTKTAIVEAIADRPDLLDALLGDLQRAIVERRLVPQLGRMISATLGPSFWKKPLGFESISDGAVSHLALEPADMHLANALLYFKQSKWNTWIAAWKARIAADGVPSAIDDATIDRWLRGEMVKRRRTGEFKGRDTMVVAMMDKFPGLSKTRAKALFTAVPENFKDRRGPKPGSHRKSAK